MRRGWPAVLFVGLLCGCGGSAALGSAATSSAVLPSTSPYPLSALAPCSQLFKDGQPIDFAKSKHGCTGPEGSRRTAHYYTCRDGAHLWRMESSTGAESGYGFDDKPYVTVPEPVAEDPSFTKLMDTCFGNS